MISHHWLKDFQIWTKMHLSTVRIPIDFGIDWPRSSVAFLISNQLFFCKLHVSYSFASFCIYLVMTSPLWCFALRLLAVCMVSGNLNTTWFDIWLHSDRPTWEMIWKIFFTFHFQIGNESKPSLKLSDCGRKIRNDVHIDTYFCKPELVSWR